MTMSAFPGDRYSCWVRRSALVVLLGKGAGGRPTTVCALGGPVGSKISILRGISSDGHRKSGFLVEPVSFSVRAAPREGVPFSPKSVFPKAGRVRSKERLRTEPLSVEACFCSPEREGNGLKQGYKSGKNGTGHVLSTVT